MINAEAYLNSDGDLNWEEYRSQLELQDIYFTEPDSPKQIFCEMGDVISICIPCLTNWAHCKEVFDMRTKLGADERATLHACAKEILGKPTHGPSISRIERYTLEKLAKVFVNKDFSSCYIWIPQWILGCISECHRSFEQSDGSYQQFCNLLCSQFSLSKTDVFRSSAMLWGMFDGLSPDRYFHLRKKTKSIGLHAVELGQKIRLAGFRSIH